MRYALLLLLSIVACRPAQRGAEHPSAPDDGGSARLVEKEKPILASLAIVDARFERRLRERASEAGLRKAALELILAEDTQAALVEGRIDMFSFDARERALARLSIPALDLADVGSGTLARPKLEGELLRRLLEEEKLRVTLERNLPASASDLVRGIVDTWKPAGDDAIQSARDEWLTRRLGELETAIANTRMPREEQYELEDALDPLEQRLQGYSKATQTLAHLRVTLGAQTPTGASPWNVVARELGPHLGTVPPPDALLERFGTLERSLRPQTQPDDAAQLAVKKLLLEGGEPCALEGRGSIVRALGTPPERDLACRIVRAVAQDDPSAPLAMHRVLALAIAAVGAHSGKNHDVPPGVLQAIPALGVRAAGKPAPCIVGAVAIEHLLAAADPASRAKAWLEFGDAPLDVIVREVR
jgi:hypothetical protein